MAQDDGQERTESATPKRRDEARKEGRVPKSAELSGAALLLAGTGVLAASGGASLAQHAVNVFRTDILWLSSQPMTGFQAIAIVQQVGRMTLLALLPVLLGIGALTLLVNAVQARGVLSFEALSPKFDRVDPVAGFGRIFSLDSVFALLKSILKVAILGWVTYLILRRAWPEVIAAGGVSVELLLPLTRGLALKMAFLTGLAFLAIAGLDYGFQLFQFEKSLRMTKQEVVQEHKETDGDPQVKGRIRQLQRQMARKRMLQNVATADVVVTNPTHIAVALKYDPLVAAAPLVVAMGERLIAQRIKELAFKAGIPVIENKPLARALLASAKVNEPVPPALYVAVAEIIAFVFRKRGSQLPARRNK